MYEELGGKQWQPPIPFQHLLTGGELDVSVHLPRTRGANISELTLARVAHILKRRKIGVFEPNLLLIPPAFWSWLFSIASNGHPLITAVQDQKLPPSGEF